MGPESSISMSNVEKFNGENFALFKATFLAIMDLRNLGYIFGRDENSFKLRKISEENGTLWSDMITARAVMLLCLKPNILSKVYHFPTVIEIWGFLLSQYESRDISNRIRLFHDLFSLKYSQGSLEDHIDKLKSTAVALRALDVVLSQEIEIAVLFSIPTPFI